MFNIIETEQTAVVVYCWMLRETLEMRGQQDLSTCLSIFFICDPSMLVPVVGMPHTHTPPCTHTHIHKVLRTHKHQTNGPWDRRLKPLERLTTQKQLLCSSLTCCFNGAFCSCFSISSPLTGRATGAQF